MRLAFGMQAMSWVGLGKNPAGSQRLWVKILPLPVFQTRTYCVVVFPTQRCFSRSPREETERGGSDTAGIRPPQLLLDQAQQNCAACQSFQSPGLQQAQRQKESACLLVSLSWLLPPHLPIPIPPGMHGSCFLNPETLRLLFVKLT